MDFKLLGKRLQGLGRVYDQNTDAEAVTQHGKDSCDPPAFLFPKRSGCLFVASAAIPGGVLGELRLTDVKERYIFGR